MLGACGGSSTDSSGNGSNLGGVVITTHSCAVLLADDVRYYGSDANGELGNGVTENSTVPSAVINLSEVNHVVAHRFHTCAITESGVVKCWGLGLDGQLGNGGLPFAARSPQTVPNFNMRRSQ